MNSQKWNRLLALCLAGLWIFAACRSASVQTTIAPAPTSNATASPVWTPTGKPADARVSTPVGQASPELVLSMDDNGTVIQLSPGQRFDLQLGDDVRWEVTIADPNIVRRVIGNPTVPGEQGVYEAVNTGQTNLVASPSHGGEGFEVTIDVSGGEALRQTPGPTSSQPLYFNQVRMETPLEGWALGSSLAPPANSSKIPQSQGVFRTTDGGLTWQNVTPPSLIPGSSVIAYFAGLQQAWLASYGVETGDGNPGSIVIYSTTDGGQTWHTGKPIGSEAGEDGQTVGVPEGLTFADDQNGWLLTHPGAEAGTGLLNIYRTTDGGQTWAMVASSGDRSSGLPSGCIETGIAFRDPQTGWITSACTGGPLFFYVTQDGGQTWASGRLQPPSNFPADQFAQCRCSVLPPQFPGGEFGVLPVTIFDDGPTTFLYLSQNGGQSWLPYSLPTSTFDIAPDFSDELNGWISDGKSLYVTQNGGQSWTWVNKMPTPVIIGGLNLVNFNTGFLTDGRQLYASQDGGITWTSWQPVRTSN